MLGDIPAAQCGLSLEWEWGSDSGKEERREEPGPAFERAYLLGCGVWTLSKDNGTPLRSFCQGSEGSGLHFTKVPVAAVWIME